MNCQIQDCTHRYYAKEFCEMHYARVRKHGDPLQTDLPRLSFDPQQFIDRGDSCVEWDGSAYPEIRKNGKMTKMSRIILEIILARPIRPKHGALHTCDNPKCINGAHLYEETARDNARDRDSRGRAAKGVKPRAKLTRDEVNQVRALLKSGIPYRRLAPQFGVTTSAIHHIKRYRSWRDV